MTRELRELVKVVANPDYDKRARHGDRAVARLTIGTRIIVRRSKEQVADMEIEAVTFRLVHNQYAHFTPRKFVQQVLDASVTVEASTVKEYLLLHDEEQFTANEILESLFQNPDVRPLIEAALKARQEIQNRDDYESSREHQW